MFLHLFVFRLPVIFIYFSPHTTLTFPFIAIFSFFSKRFFLSIFVCDDGSAVSGSQCGYTALMEAAQWGHAECVRLLIDAGADKDAKDNVRRRSRLPHFMYFPSHITFLLVSFPGCDYYFSISEETIACPCPCVSLCHSLLLSCYPLVHAALEACRSYFIISSLF
jgi:hypothetical protein